MKFSVRNVSHFRNDESMKIVRPCPESPTTIIFISLPMKIFQLDPIHNTCIKKTWHVTLWYSEEFMARNFFVRIRLRITFRRFFATPCSIMWFKSIQFNRDTMQNLKHIFATQLASKSSNSTNFRNKMHFFLQKLKEKWRHWHYNHDHDCTLKLRVQYTNPRLAAKGKIYLISTFGK